MLLSVFCVDMDLLLRFLHRSAIRLKMDRKHDGQFVIFGDVSFFGKILLVRKGLVLRAGFEPANPYGKGFPIWAPEVKASILSPSPLTWLGYRSM
jgi:hypothetical protein